MEFVDEATRAPARDPAAMPTDPAELRKETLRKLWDVLNDDEANPTARVGAGKCLLEDTDLYARFFDLFPSHQAAARWLVAEMPRLIALAGVDAEEHAEPHGALVPKEKP